MKRCVNKPNSFLGYRISISYNTIMHNNIINARIPYCTGVIFIFRSKLIYLSISNNNKKGLTHLSMIISWPHSLSHLGSGPLSQTKIWACVLMVDYFITPCQHEQLVNLPEILTTNIVILKHFDRNFKT